MIAHRGRLSEHSVGAGRVQSDCLSAPTGRLDVIAQAGRALIYQLSMSSK